MKLYNNYIVINNKQIFFKKFSYQEISIRYLSALLTHSSTSTYLTHFNLEYILKKNYSKILLNLFLTQNNYKKGLTILNKTIQNGGRCWIVNTFTNTKKKKNEIRNYKYDQLLKKIHHFFLNGINKKYFNILSLQNYNYGLLTNFKLFRKKQTNLEKNTHLFEFFKISKKNRDLMQLPVNSGIGFFPDLVVIEKNTKEYSLWLSNEIKKIQIPAIYLAEINVQPKPFIYNIASANNNLTQLVFNILVLKTLIKTIINKIQRFEYKTINTKIKLKKKIFSLSLNKKKKTIEKDFSVNSSIFLGSNKLTKILLNKNRQKLQYNFNQLYISHRLRYNIYKKLSIRKKFDLFTFWYYRLLTRWKITSFLKKTRHNKKKKIKSKKLSYIVYTKEKQLKLKKRLLNIIFKKKYL